MFKFCFCSRFLTTIFFTVTSLLYSGKTQTALAAGCNLTNVTPVNFGAYDVFSSSPTEAVGNVTYRCIDLGSGLITIDLSKGSSTTYNPRTLRSGTETLNYNLYLDSGHNTIWGDGTDSSNRYGPLNPPDNSDVSLSIYGRIPAQQTNTKVGSYSDTITITINF